MAHTARGYCWTSQDDSIPERTHHFDDGHYHSIVNKPVINATRLPSKPSGYYLLRDRRENAKNAYTFMCDAMMGLWQDGLDYTRAVNFAVRWLRRFNELSGIPEE